MTVRVLRTTAKRIQHLQAEIDELTGQQATLVDAVAPWLARPARCRASHRRTGLVSWSYAGRLRSEAAFAALAGVSPIPASSGQVMRHRLNRSGDRQRNRALHTIVLARLRDDHRPAPTPLDEPLVQESPVRSDDDDTFEVIRFDKCACNYLPCE